MRRRVAVAIGVGLTAVFLHGLPGGEGCSFSASLHHPHSPFPPRFLSPLLPFSPSPLPPLSGFPPTEAVFTSTRQVTSLAIAPDGALWAGTMGGVLRRSPDGTWQKFTRQEGLPAHEVRGLVIDHGEVVAIFPTASAVWRAGAWQMEPAPRPLPFAEIPGGAAPEGRPLCAALWRGRRCVATVTGLQIAEGTAWQQVPWPPSRGTHISALLPRGDALWVALFGDGLWAFNGQTWQRLELGLPPSAREITALASDGSTVWLGTRREGLWEYDGTKWIQHLQPEEPYDHNGQALAMFHGHLFVSTLEDGLVVRTEEGWQHLTEGLLSSSAPRQMVEFQGSLYLRHGNGKVDRFDGERWYREVCSALPRKEAMALTADPKRLYVAQWGGWSEFDGQTWKHHLHQPELQGVPITALYSEREVLWISTQGRGLAEVNRNRGQLRWHDERQGLPDDWVKCLVRVGPSLYVGTFVGGLARGNGTRWETVAPLDQGEVTALEPDGAGGVFIATRTGVWHQGDNGMLEPLHSRLGNPYPEAQALCRVAGGLWIATRTGLYFRTL